MASSKNYMLNDEFPKRIKNATSTSDGLMSSEDKSRLDEVFEFGLLTPATPENDGIMIKEDKIKLNGIEEGANNYIHPDDENTRHVTDEQIAYWNSKADNIQASPESNGLMSAEDKTKLDNLTNYTHPDTHLATMIVEDDMHRFVTDEQINDWNNKASNSLVTQTNNGLMSKIDKTKLDNLTNYTHPDTHPATIIVEDKSHRFVTDEQISLWNAKLDNIPLVTEIKEGLMSAADKLKLDSIDAVTGTYTHPDTHPAGIIVEDETHRFVTDDQISSWNNLIDKVAYLEEKIKTAVFYA